ncbi:transglycosylase SLT domain-containing protein [Hydrocarboniphaga effusa]|uniref:transglycosylase SLT domain-containing protein n=1 Tax=Hydrocarboniphaga effusa TaxID=243629 RepID=UPI003BAB23AF
MSLSTTKSIAITEREIDGATTAAADRWSIPRELVLAICKTESSFDPFAMRFEPDYRYLFDTRAKKPYRVRAEDMSTDRAPADFQAPAGLAVTAHSEWIAQQTSFGLMQTMGAVAREYGFEGYLTALCDPYFSCDIGCRLLADLVRRNFAKYGWPGVLSAYNTGTATSKDGKAYSDKVFRNGGPFLVRALGGKA